jgi:hypothetical protein
MELAQNALPDNKLLSCLRPKKRQKGEKKDQESTLYMFMIIFT